jgi:hypothetical protein
MLEEHSMIARSIFSGSHIHVSQFIGAGMRGRQVVRVRSRGNLLVERRKDSERRGIYSRKSNRGASFATVRDDGPRY